MKRFLHKKWHSIPVGIITAVLLVCLLAGGVLAYQVWTSNVEVEVEESIEVVILEEAASPVYPNQGGCDKYLIQNFGSAPVDVTVTMEVLGTDRTEFEGLTIVYSNETGEYGPLYGMAEIVISTPEVQHLTYTFPLGTYDYAHAEAWEEGKGMSSYAKVFAGFKVKNGASPGPVDIKVTVERN